MSAKVPPCEYEDVLEFYGNSKRASLLRSLQLVRTLISQLKTNEWSVYLSRHLIPVECELKRQLSHTTQGL